VTAITSCPDLLELCPIRKWDGAAIFLVFELTKDTGTGPEIVSIEGFLAFGDLDRSPRDDKPVALEADMHVVFFYPWQVKDRRYG